MKRFSTFISEAVNSNGLDVKQSYIKPDDLKKFAEAAGKMLSSTTMGILNHAIADDKDFDINDTTYKQDISKLKKAHREKELPWLLTEEELSNVINSKKPLDFYAWDLTSEAGRNWLVKKFEPMLHSTAQKYANANGISKDDTFGPALEGFTRALNNYGKKRSEYVRTKSEEANIDLDAIKAKEDDTVRNIPFASYATAMVSNSILDYLKNEMNLVRRPQSDQAKEREETGKISTQAVTHGDASIGKDSEGTERNMWDKLSAEYDSESENGSDKDAIEIEKMWKEIFKAVEAKFGKEIAELWYTKNGLNGRKQDNKASTSTEYYKLRNIAKFLLTDKKCRGLLDDIRDMM